MPEAKIKHPKLFTLTGPVSFINSELKHLAKLEPRGPSDCFEITKESMPTKAPRTDIELREDPKQRYLYKKV